jgi:hypothetical protein
MVKLWYIFWAMPLFFAGCANHDDVIVLQYRPEFFQQETSTPRPPSAVFDPPHLAESDAFGRDQIAGVDLNQRFQPQVVRGYILGETQSYQYYYVDYGPGWGGWGGCGGWGGGGGPSSTLYYYRSGVIAP